MSSVDISRKLFQPAKHYAGAIYPQGRVTLDSDQNEGAMLAGEELRRLSPDAEMAVLPEGFMVIPDVA